MSEWISVKERLPEVGNGMFLVSYLFAGKHPCMMVCAWYGGAFRGLDLIAMSTVTHWMPLPEPPEAA
jgi:hypothetical protein